jgi:hypothetical protein
MYLDVSVSGLKEGKGIAYEWEQGAGFKFR